MIDANTMAPGLRTSSEDGNSETLKPTQVAQAHVSRKSQRLTHERVTRCVTRCQVTKGTVENLNTL